MYFQSLKHYYYKEFLRMGYNALCTLKSAEVSEEYVVSIFRVEE
jgi:hypothetical protein